MTASVFGGITSSLVGALLRVIMYFTVDRSRMVFDHFFLNFSELLLGIVVAILYMLLVSAIAYLLGMLVQANITFVILLPAIIFALLKVYSDFAQFVFMFYVGETSLPLFALKAIITSIILFGVSLLLSNEKEVGQ